MGEETAHKATHLFILKVFEIPKNFSQKVFGGVWGSAPSVLSCKQMGQGPHGEF